jgi:group II intron reverse transcriptase/maturase
MSLAHHIDIEFLFEAHRRVRKDGAVGVDGQTAREYEANLEENLRSLLNRFKSGLYRAPAVRRVHIPKGDGSKTRPIGIPTFEDKVLQKAVAMVLEAVYEQDFLAVSYGFRPNRSAHGALEHLRSGLMEMRGGWLLDVDIASFFDELDHGVLRGFLEQRVRDGVIGRAIGKWLNAGVMEGGEWHHSGQGTPQGGVISPLLANVYLHVVVDQWFEEVVRPRLRGRGFMVRYADDLVMAFTLESDARRVLDALGKRLNRFGLRLHAEKTRLVRFTRPPYGGKPSAESKPETFDFLGFTHFWGRSRRRNWIVKKKTASNRLTRALQRINVWCRQRRHMPVWWQRDQLASKLRGHYGYYGVIGNRRALLGFLYGVQRHWRKWLNRRSQKGGMTWERFTRLRLGPSLPTPPKVTIPGVT